MPVVDQADCNPFLRPEWRYERVLQMIDRPEAPGRCTRYDDKWVKGMRSFLLRYRKADDYRREILSRQEHGPFWAWMIHDSLAGTEPEVKFMVEAGVLAGEKPEVIAESQNTLPECVEWYEKVFFDARPRLHKHNWITKAILLPSSDRLSEDVEKDEEGTRRFVTPPVIRAHLDFTAKFFCFFGGKIPYELMISGFKMGYQVRAVDDIGDWLDEIFMTGARRRSAQSVQVFEVNKYNVMDLFAIHTRCIEIAKSAESQDEKRTTIERHINSMLGEIPWTVGAESKQLFEGTTVGEFDEMSAELRDDELLLVAAGEKPNIVDDLPDLEMPLSTAKEGDNADPKSD